MDHPSTSVNTFVVRIWVEWSDLGSSWRGQILYLPGNDKATFLTLHEMVTFIQTHVGMPSMGSASKGGQHEDC